MTGAAKDGRARTHIAGAWEEDGAGLGSSRKFAILLGLHQAVHIVVIGVVPHALGLQLQGVGMVVRPAVLCCMALAIPSAPDVPAYQAHPQVLSSINVFRHSMQVVSWQAT